MCVSYPGLVIAVDPVGAVVRGEHRDFRASVVLVPDIRPGEYVVVAAGVILERIGEEEATEIRALLDAARAADGVEPSDADSSATRIGGSAP
jgi:hydrogenase maturation factor